MKKTICQCEQCDYVDSTITRNNITQSDLQALVCPKCGIVGFEFEDIETEDTTEGNLGRIASAMERIADVLEMIRKNGLDVKR